MNEINLQSPVSSNSKRRSTYLSFDEWIVKMQLAFTNGKLPAILPILETVGYSVEILDNYLQKTDELTKLNRTMQLEYAERLAATEKIKALRLEINKTYGVHRGLAKVIFRKEVKAIAAMRLRGRVKNSYHAWMEDTENFYLQIEGDAEFSTQAASIGITPEVTSEMLKKLTALHALKKSQSKEAAEAQQATEARNIAFGELKEIYCNFTALAKLVLKNNQALEAMGVVVRR